jgi:hypothetical protein
LQPRRVKCNIYYIKARCQPNLLTLKGSFAPSAGSSSEGRKPASAEDEPRQARQPHSTAEERARENGMNKMVAIIEPSAQVTTLKGFAG